MNTQIATFLFLLASAMGATIIVAKGDIFHAFRAWILSKSKKNKVWVHDITLPPNSPRLSFSVNGELDTSISQAQDISSLTDWLMLKCSEWYVEIERLPDFSTRIYIKSKNKHNLGITTGDTFVQHCKAFGVYEKSDTIKWISFIHDMISCPQCCGVWVGMIWFILYTIGAMAFFVFQMLCMGCIVSLFASLYWKLHDLLNSYTNKK